MNILIIDDDKEMINTLKKDLFIFFSERYNQVNFDIYDANFSKIDSSKIYDFIFVDINLNTINGIDLIKDAGLTFRKTKIIFISAYLNLIHDSLIVQPFYFIRKSYYKSDLDKFFALLNNQIDERKVICLSYKRENNYVNLVDVMYIESIGHELKVATKDKIYSDNRKLKEMLYLIEDDASFARVHKSYIINLDYLESFRNNVLTLTNKLEIPLGRIYRKDFEKIFQRYLIK